MTPLAYRSHAVKADAGQDGDHATKTAEMAEQQRTAAMIGDGDVTRIDDDGG